MFANNHHSMVGSEEDPEDGGKVAAAVFGAVAVYAVRAKLGTMKMMGRWDANHNHGSGFPPLLRLPSDHAQETERPWRNSTALIRRSRLAQIVRILGVTGPAFDMSISNHNRSKKASFFPSTSIGASDQKNCSVMKELWSAVECEWEYLLH